MVGTLIVGGMAFYLYGPPRAEINQWIDRLTQTADGLRYARSAARDERPATSHPPAPSATGELSPAAPTVKIDRNVRPASNVAPLEREVPTPLPPLDEAPTALDARDPSAGVPHQTAALLGALKALGAQELRLSPWGAEGGLYRFECCATMPGGAGFVRHFDAIQPHAHDAVARVLQDVRQWRDEGAGRLTR